jgi:hypothetical protein
VATVVSFVTSSSSSRRLTRRFPLSSRALLARAAASVDVAVVVVAVAVVPLLPVMCVVSPVAWAWVVAPSAVVATALVVQLLHTVVVTEVPLLPLTVVAVVVTAAAAVATATPLAPPAHPPGGKPVVVF